VGVASRKERLARRRRRSKQANSALCCKWQRIENGLALPYLRHRWLRQDRHGSRSRLRRKGRRGLASNWDVSRN